MPRCTLLALITLILPLLATGTVRGQETLPKEFKPGAGGVKQTTPDGQRTGILDPEYNPNLPTVFFIGDSTVKNSWGNGDGGLWGWADFIDPYFDLSKMNVENEALGGTSSRSFISQGHWGRVRDLLKPGDFVIMQFGHNDGANMGRGSLPGSGEETQEVPGVNGAAATVSHTFGWYLNFMASEAKAKGATPVICSLIPRNTWRDGKIVRGQANTYVKWSQETAEKHGYLYIDLNKIICDKYDALGESNIKGKHFGNDGTHPIFDGAASNAECVVAGIRGLPGDPLGKFLSAKGAAVPAIVSPVAAKAPAP